MFIAKNYSDLLGISFLSDELLNNHFKLYEGYVANTNAVYSRLQELVSEEKTGAGEYGELKRRFGWEFNGMRLHELYFEGLTKSPKEFDNTSNLYKKITEDFGSFEDWKKDFIATGSMRGIGWVLLVHDKVSDTLINIWVNEHEAGHLTGVKPLLIMDVFEHAFITDYGLKKVDYISGFMNSIDWDIVESRFI